MISSGGDLFVAFLFAMAFLFVLIVSHKISNKLLSVLIKDRIVKITMANGATRWRYEQAAFNAVKEMKVEVV